MENKKVTLSNYYVLATLVDLYEHHWASTIYKENFEAFQKRDVLPIQVA